LRAVFEHSALGIARLDRRARIVDANEAFERFFGRALADLSGRALTEFAAAEDSQPIYSLVVEVLAREGSSATREARFVQPDGKLAWGALMLSRAEGSLDLGLIAVVQDVSERKALEAELLHQAFHDSLTGLANRALFRDRVEHALAHGSREAERVGVLFIDRWLLSINDTRGPAAGNRVLQQIAAALLNATPWLRHRVAAWG
jgi:PAS domain S-box-containing protein